MLAGDLKKKKKREREREKSYEPPLLGLLDMPNEYCCTLLI